MGVSSILSDARKALRRHLNRFGNTFTADQVMEIEALIECMYHTQSVINDDKEPSQIASNPDKLPDGWEIESISIGASHSYFYKTSPDGTYQGWFNDEGDEIKIENNDFRPGLRQKEKASAPGLTRRTP